MSSPFIYSPIILNGAEILTWSTRTEKIMEIGFTAYKHFLTKIRMSKNGIQYINYVPIKILVKVVYRVLFSKINYQNLGLGTINTYLILNFDFLTIKKF